MGRYWLSALLVVGLATRAFAAEDFAIQELDKYFSQMTAGGKHGLKLDVQIDPTLGGGKETYSIRVAESSYTITGSNKNIALTGVYYLLDNAGCRFLAPDFDHYKGSAEYVPPQMGVITFAGSMMWSPALKFRKLYVEEGHSHTPENLAQLVEWMPKVGYNTLVIPTNYQGRGRVMWDNFRAKVAPECQKRGITIEVGGHGYQNFMNAEMDGGKLFDQHPEWFGQDQSGKRTKAQGRVFCTSNPQAFDYFVNNFLAYVKERPEIQIYDMWPPDGAKWCECEKCTALGSPPDRQAILMRQVQERVKPVRPDLRLEMIAYAAALKPPQHEKVDKSILVDFCPIGQQFDHQINDPAAEKNREYADGLLAWRKAFDGDISIYSYYRKYAWDSLPVIIPHYMQTDLQWYATLPVQGVSVYSEPGDWFTYELNHYVLAALAWDPNADVDAVIRKFCDARYGGESALAQEVFAALEKIVRKDCSVPNVSLKSAEEIAKAQADMKGIVEKLSAAESGTGDPVLKRSLNRLGLMCTYAAQDLDIQHLRAAGGGKEQITAKADELHKFLEKHGDDGVFLVKDQRISPARMLKRYGVSVKGE